MSIVLAGITPHPPLIIPSIGGSGLARVANTCAAMETLAQDVKQAGPEAIVIITPHGPVFRDVVAVAAEPVLEGNFARFGAAHVGCRADNDLELVQEIVHACGQLQVPILELTKDMRRKYRLEPELDHGTMVPLYYLQKAGIVAPLVVVSMAFLPPERLYDFGRSLALAVTREGKRVVVIASGDLSHRLTPDAPAGYDKMGKEYDQQIVEIVENGNLVNLLAIDPNLVEKAGECGWRSFIMLAGAVADFQVESKVLSYEGPFGVGYLVARLKVGKYMGGEKGAHAVSDHVRLARASLETYVRTGKMLDLPHPLPSGLEQKAGAFVSLKKQGRLRGCIGTIRPTQSSLAAEIIHNAVSAGIHDPRFTPVQEAELDQLVYSVDVLGDLEPINSMDELDPFRYGVVVQAGRKTGLLLPNLDGIDTVTEQVDIACQKAGIRPGEKIKLFRFVVERYEE
ncbi:MAG: AmmeMemoRadiSam system protein A [bacterium]|jgi:AmmeMemoRadiSam system protein A/AmmeMemoRadiSam system protein B